MPPVVFDPPDGRLDLPPRSFEGMFVIREYIQDYVITVPTRSRFYRSRRRRIDVSLERADPLPPGKEPAEATRRQLCRALHELYNGFLIPAIVDGEEVVFAHRAPKQGLLYT